MRITLIAVGKIKEDWMKKGISEYEKRISKYCELEFIEIPDAPEGDSIEKAIAEEGRKILARIKEHDFVVALDLRGEMPDSVQFSEKMMQWLENGGARVTLLIAGSNGYLPEVLQRADAKVCLSKMTFPHQLARLILLEQIFRAFKIAKGEKYHK